MVESTGHMPTRDDAVFKGNARQARMSVIRDATIDRAAGGTNF
jgi:hypothetical protein